MANEIAEFIGTSEPRKVWVEHACFLYASVLLKKENEAKLRAETPDAELWLTVAKDFVNQMTHDITRN